jgi:putative transposase
VSERRDLVRELPRLGVSERRACRVVGLARASFRDPLPPSPAAEGERRGAVRRLARAHRRDGYRRLTALLRRQGHRVKATRVWRLWTCEGWSLPRQRPRRRRQGASMGLPPRALKPNQVWTDDFLCDRTEAGPLVTSRIVWDEDTRERLALRVERHLGAGEVIETLAWVLMPRGAPEYLRSDNGPECIAPALHAWLAAAAQETRTVVHRTRAAVGEWVGGALHREVARGRPERSGLPEPRGRAGGHRELAARGQAATTASRAGRPDTGGEGVERRRGRFAGGQHGETGYTRNRSGASTNLLPGPVLGGKSEAL